MTEIKILDEAYERAAKAVEAYGLVASSDAYDIASDAIRAAAPLIVAAELERLAQTCSEDGPYLRARAKELQGGQP